MLRLKQDGMCFINTLMIDPHVAYSYPLHDTLIEKNTTSLQDMLAQADSSFSSKHPDIL